MNSFGRLFNITLYGESHQEAIGVVIQGMPPGCEVDETALNKAINRRRPGAIGTTPRMESDLPIVTSGIYEGKTTGSPVHIMFRNSNTQSKDYTHLLKHPRPGHADFVANVKYQGHQDPRGGGRFSGRLTLPLVAAGYFARRVCEISIESELIQVGTLTDMSKLDAYLDDIAAAGDSVGAIMEIRAKGLPIGLGEPFFDSLESNIAHIFYAIPGVKGVEFGLGFRGVALPGSVQNDVIINAEGHTKTNHAGGIHGGISNGNDLIIRVAIKPTSSIGKLQNSYHFDKNDIAPLVVGGRHDVCFARRTNVIFESALAIVLADFHLIHQSYQKRS